jgi:hypothetical protein
VAQHPFPDPGHDGDEPSPGVPARDWADEDDRYLDWLAGEIEAGRVEIPPEEEPSPGVTVSLGEAGTPTWMSWPGWPTGFLGRGSTDTLNKRDSY